MRRRFATGIVIGLVLAVSILTVMNVSTMVRADGDDAEKDISGIGMSGFKPQAEGQGLPVLWHPDNGISIGVNLYSDGINVGIGTYTPLEVLDVNGNIMLSATDAAPQIKTRGNKPLVLNASSDRVDLWDGTNAKILRIYDGQTEAIRLAATGDSFFNGGPVGIGTKTPLEMLDVNGNIMLSATGFSPQIKTAGNRALVLNPGSNFVDLYDGINAKVLRIYDKTSPRIRLDASERSYFIGALGIGTSTPQRKLHVLGVILSSEGGVEGRGAIELTGFNITPRENRWLYFYDQLGADYGRTEGIAAHSIFTETPSFQSSDLRLKKNINTIPGALDTILSLRGVEFEWKDQRNEGEAVLGFVAQELEQVVPGMVIDGPNGYKGASYSSLIPVLVEAVKEQNALIELQGSQLAALQAQIAALEARFAALE